jgi:hypothetical protein
MKEISQSTLYHPHKVPSNLQKTKRKKKSLKSMSSQMIFAKYSFKSNTWDARKDRSGR